MKLLIENWKKFINEGEYHPETEQLFDQLLSAATNAKEALGIPYDPQEYLRFVEKQAGGNSNEAMIARANYALSSATQTDKSRLAYDDTSINEQEMQVVNLSPDQIEKALSFIPERNKMLDIFDTKDKERGGFMHKLSNANKALRWGLAERLFGRPSVIEKGYIKMKLLREYYELCDGGVCQDLLTEDEKRFVAAGGMYLTGKLQQANTQNGNGRVYPYEVLVREVENYKKLVKENRALGELDHPDDSVINLKNASHLVTSIWMDGDTVMGKVKVLDTPSGQVLKSLVESGVKLGISSRGMGSVENRNGQTVVQDDFQLICFDFVSEPSTPEAFMVKEGKEYTNQVFTKADRINRLLNEVLKDGDVE